TPLPLHTYIGTKIVQAMPETHSNGAEGYRVVYADGYVSWSPKEAFDEAYRLTDRMTFGDALAMLKAGLRVARKGWNGQGMWLKLVPAELAGAVSFQFAALRPLPWIGMKTADNGFVPWLASQTDALAEDWQVLE